MIQSRLYPTLSGSLVLVFLFLWNGDLAACVLPPTQAIDAGDAREYCLLDTTPADAEESCRPTEAASPLPDGISTSQGNVGSPGVHSLPLAPPLSPSDVPMQGMFSPLKKL
jgi:hypothetical protein